MKVKAKQLFCSPVYGNVKEGDIINVAESIANELKALDLVVMLEIKPEPKKATVKNKPKSGK